MSAKIIDIRERLILRDVEEMKRMVREAGILGELKMILPWEEDADGDN